MLWAERTVQNGSGFGVRGSRFPVGEGCMVWRCAKQGGASNIEHRMRKAEGGRRKVGGSPWVEGVRSTVDCGCLQPLCGGASLLARGRQDLDEPYRSAVKRRLRSGSNLPQPAVLGMLEEGAAQLPAGALRPCRVPPARVRSPRSLVVLSSGQGGAGRRTGLVAVEAAAVAVGFEEGIAAVSAFSGDRCCGALGVRTGSRHNLPRTAEV